MPQGLRYRLFETPAGAFALIRDDRGALAATWPELEGGAVLRPATHDAGLLPELSERLESYFAGETAGRDAFDDVATPEGPPFYRRCWAACRSIPPGRTRSYAELAALSGADRGAARAAGQAMRRNPLPVIVPCHRVVGAGGDAGGYAGDRDARGRSLKVKRALLELEGFTT